jgi:hypothetical protein
LSLFPPSQPFRFCPIAAPLALPDLQVLLNDRLSFMISKSIVVTFQEIKNDVE